jgi:hypothetical protein
MAKFLLYVGLKAKPGKQAEVEAFLKSALLLAQQETQTVTWYAFAEGEGSYGIFDAFDTEAGRQAKPIWTGPSPKPSWPRPLNCWRRRRRFTSLPCSPISIDRRSN